MNIILQAIKALFREFNNKFNKRVDSVETINSSKFSALEKDLNSAKIEIQKTSSASSNALSRADGAYSLADTAKNAANSANMAASNAQNTADNAKSELLTIKDNHISQNNNDVTNEVRGIILERDPIYAPFTAQPGQTIVVKSVDDNGKPTEWECVDMASDEHITSLINNALGVIENGTY